MQSRATNPVWITLVVVLVIGAVFAASSLIAADKPAAKAPAAATAGSGMHGTGGMQCGTGCTKLNAKVVSVAQDGTLTVQAKAADAAAKKALAKVKVGDTLPMMVMSGGGQDCKMMGSGAGSGSGSCPMGGDMSGHMSGGMNHTGSGASGHPAGCPMGGM